MISFPPYLRGTLWPGIVLDLGKSKIRRHTESTGGDSLVNRKSWFMGKKSVHMIWEPSLAVQKNLPEEFMPEPWQTKEKEKRTFRQERLHWQRNDTETRWRVSAGNSPGIVGKDWATVSLLRAGMMSQLSLYPRHLAKHLVSREVELSHCLLCWMNGGLTGNHTNTYNSK